MSGPRQHIVQRRLLQNFSTNRGIWQFDKENPDAIVMKPFGLKGVAFELNFLTKPADDVITAIEGECISTITRIMEKKMIFPSSFFTEVEVLENLICLYRYIALQLSRTPWYREKFLSSYKNPQEAQSNLFLETPAEFIAQDFGFGRISNDPMVFGKMTNHYRLSIEKLGYTSIRKFDLLAASLYEMTLPIVVTNTTSVPYIQSDIGLCPFFPIGDTTLNLKYRTERGTKLNIICVFPLAPNVIVCLCTHDSVQLWTSKFPPNSGQGLLLESHDQEDIKFTNFWMYQFAKRFIFSSIKFDISLTRSERNMPQFQYSN